jgi:hypothetical protein
MAANPASFQIVLKTVADTTGIAAIGTSVKELNAQLRGLASGLNEALGLIGISLATAALEQYAEKATDAAKAQAVFMQAVARSKDGSEELYNQLKDLNDELAKTTGTSPETSRSIEQLYLRAGVAGDKIGELSKATIEFAASSAGTVQPVELAALIARRLSVATDEAGISLRRIGISAKDLNGIMTEMAARGGSSAEAMEKASGGMGHFAVQTGEAEKSLGRFVNLFRVPLLTGFAEGMDGAKTKIDGVTQSYSKLGEIAFVSMKVVADSVGGLLDRSLLLFEKFYAQSDALVSRLAILVNTALQTIVGGIAVLVNGAITGIDTLAQHAADVAKELSGGLIDIKVDPTADEKARQSITNFANFLKDKLGQDNVDLAKGVQDAIDKVDQTIAEMEKRGESGFSKLEEYKKQYQDFVKSLSYQETTAGIKQGSGVITPADPNAGKKAAADALTQSIYQLDAAQKVYEADVEKTKLLEDAGVISVQEGDAKRRTAILAYIAQLKQLQAEIPKTIALEEKMGKTKGVDELKLELLEIEKRLLKLQHDLADTTPYGKIHNALTQLKNDWTDIGKQVGQFLTEQFTQFASTAGSAISGLIFQTQTWQQAITQVAESFVSSLATMVIQWILARTVISALNKAFGAADSALVSAQGEAAATAWAPGATAASIASYGAAAGVGLAAYLSAIGIGTAGTIAAAGAGGSGFEQGGYTFGRPGQFAGIVHGGEYVFSAPAVRNVGLGLLDSLHNVGVSGPGHGPAAAPGAGGSGSSGGHHFYLFTDRESLHRHWQSNPTSKKTVIDWVNSAGGHLRT